MEKFAHLPDLRTVQPERLVKYRISEDRFTAEVLLPGFAYTDFDQKIGGKLNLWSLAKIFECIRYAVLIHGFGYYDQLKDEKHSIFMVSTEYHVTAKGNELTSYKVWGLRYTMLATLNVTNVSTSTFSFTADVKDVGTMERLFTAKLTFVYMGYNTRKPAKFPDWYNERRRLSNIGSAPKQRLITPVIQSNAFSDQVKSTYSDIDFNGHVNNSVYIKWCTDAGTAAALKGHYSRFTGNIGKYPLEKIDLKYVKEGMPGEHFVINTWEDSMAPLVLHFVITKGGVVAFVAKFVYRTGEESLLSRL